MLGDLISATTVIAGTEATPLLGKMSDAILPQLSQDRRTGTAAQQKAE
jgi:hypothetical protein